MLAGSTFSFICGYFTPHMCSSCLPCASPGPLGLTVFVSLLWVTFFGHRVRFLCLFGAFFFLPLFKVASISPHHSAESPFGTGSSVVFI